MSKLDKLLEGVEVEWKTLGDICKIFGGLTGKSKADFENGNAKYVSYKNIFYNIEIDFETLENVKVSSSENQYEVKYGDVLFTGSSEIAEESGYSISTVSRTLSDKYYEFNDHMYPVKDLFISKTHKGSSKDSIQKAIQLLIEVENPENPLQDEEIVEELENMELYASRRTISKYRKELNIPNSKQRKKARLY